VKEMNVKQLTKTLAVVSFLVPMTAQPLGIGNLKLHSALNQKLDAEIHLKLAAGENPRDVTVKLASPEKFDQAGVPWSYFLSKIRFKQVVQANGSIVVKVTSREPMTEPFLDFLLEVTWPQGSQFREFTTLIDPPAEYQVPASPSTESFDYRIEKLAEYTKPARKSAGGRKRAAHRAIASQITPQTPASGEYGPVKNAETLWGIAESLGRDHNVPTLDMMHALYNANPDAFNHGDMDSLKTGTMLRIPESEAILQGVAKVGAKVAQPAAGIEGGGKSLELVAPTEAKTGEQAETTGLGQPGREGGAGTGVGGPSGEGKALELQARIDRLEQQLNMMQQLLALKDQQLAALQSHDQEAAEKAAESAESLAAQPTQMPESVVAEPTEVPLPQEAIVAPTELPTTAVPVPTEVPPITKLPVQQQAAIEEEPGFFSSSAYFLTLGGLGVGMLGVLGWLLWRKRKIESQTNTESMFASASQIRMPDADSALAVPVLDINAAGAYDVGTVGESSFISDFTPSDFEAFDTDQTDIDPMSEADVYLAYGRYQQAEDLIRNAIEEHPEKDDYKLKLLEIFYANENKEGFAVYAQELVDIGKNNNIPFWSKVTDMGKEIIPESALFGGTGAATDTGSEAAVDKTVQQGPASFAMEDELESVGSSDDDLSDLKATTLPDMDLMDEVDSELAEMELTLSEEEEDNSLDFDLGTLGQGERAHKDAAIEETSRDVPDIESIDFDFSDVGTSDESKADQTKSEASEPLESFDFSFDTDDKGDGKSDAGSSSGEEPLDMKTLESFEFPEIADVDLEEGPSQKAPDSESSAGDSATTGEEFDFNFDFEVPGSEPKSKSADDDADFGVSDLTDMDEFETKIDLAKAYIDMGDTVAARTIAEEVLTKGNADQKKAAQALLDELK
jgi:pilus assembly protein FimV